MIEYFQTHDYEYFVLRRINQCLNPNLAKICLRSYQLEKLQDMIRRVLPEHLRAHCQAGSFQQGQLVLLVNDACWATELKFMLPELRDRLRSEYQLYQLTGIRVKVDAVIPAAPIKAEKKQSNLSVATRDFIHEEADNLPQGPLREAMKNLAGRSKQAVGTDNQD